MKLNKRAKQADILAGIAPRNIVSNLAVE